MTTASGEARPSIATWLNLTPDHLDRHRTLAAYGALKQRLFARQTEEDWAILNAGVSDSVDARRFRAGAYHRVFATNVGGAVNWLEAVLPDMISAGSGTVAGISSLAGWRGLPGAGAYSASKAALSTLLESTRVDLRGTGVDVVLTQYAPPTRHTTTTTRRIGAQRKLLFAAGFWVLGMSSMVKDATGPEP